MRQWRTPLPRYWTSPSAACPVCAGSDFYRRKDFNPKVGVTIVAIGASISAVFYWFKRDFIAYSILGFATLIDLFIYGRLKDITVCYRCHWNSEAL
jgi:hypothetical protein